ncbi:carbohydrate kinase family protein [Ornithinimicrobium cerasi]|uniref:carbohydrate kinase family protein n=1 Tax=Ornithinimicrobium cerasi TaxID=2248773 RepID=UPI000F006DE0|nr:carbohydrate kinase family protein [Ornithinimicrobium cerasi]
MTGGDGRRPSALIISGASWNRMVRVPELPRGGPQTIFAEGSHEALGSSGAGKALNLRVCGMEAALWCRLGRDEPGRRVREALSRAGVEALVEDDPAGTMEHVNLMDPAGGRVSVFVVRGSLDEPVGEPWRSELIRRAVGADVVAVTIFEQTRSLLAPLRAAGVPLWVDVHDHDGVDPYHRDYVEAASFLQLSSVAMPGWRSFAEGRVRAGATAVVCTHGADGASVVTAEGWVEVPAVPVAEVVDTNGAGDAFFAGFASGWVAGLDVLTCARRGAERAAAAVGSWELA